MARGGGRSSGRSASPSRSSTNSSRGTTQAIRPPQINSSVPMQGQSGGMLGGIGSTIMTGMAFGGGSEIGHQIVRSMTGGSGHKEQQPQQQVENTNNNAYQNNNANSNPCQSFNMKFVDCLKMSNNEIAQCQSIFDDLKVCQKSFNI
jgi:hypothetical protein